MSPALAGALVQARGEIDRLAVQVSRRGIAPRFGRKAAAIVRRTVVAAACSDAEARDLEEVLNVQLEVLFLQQLQVLVAQAIDLYDASLAHRPNALEAGLAAQALFDAGVAGLLPSGSDWSAEAAREDLSVWLSGSYDQDARLLDEQAKQSLGKQVALDVIKQLQEQKRGVLRQVETRGAFPWNVKWEYAVENSPLGFRGQYLQGRSVLEMMLTPSPDPRQKGNLLNRLGPLNLAVAFDMLQR